MIENTNNKMKALFDGKVKAWTGNMEIEAAAESQLANIADLPILAGHVAIMPDVHMGMGATVGSVIPTRGAVIPSAVGVDIGCGMIAVRTSLKATDLPDSLKSVRNQIERDVPVGFNFHTRAHKAAEWLQQRAATHLESFGSLRIFDSIEGFNSTRMAAQIGTLGGGNHFIEICIDESQDVWVMLHSGSRNVGKTVGEAAMTKAKEYMATLDITLPDKHLSWLAEGTAEFDEYVQALGWSQEYAKINRDTMLDLVLQAMRTTITKPFELTSEAVNCHHNYLSKEFHNGTEMWITRKGAVSAQAGQLGIIPGSMGAKSYIVCGKGHTEAYCSCSHGAGRQMSRTAAKKYFTVDDLEKQTAGVECRKDNGVVDEIPGAYKNIDEVMAAQSDLIEVRHTLKQVLCVKG